MQPSPESLSDADLIEAIYAGIADGAETERAIRGAIARLDASGGNIHVVGAQSLETRYFVGFGEGYTQDAVTAFLDHWQYANAHREAMRRAYVKHGASVYLCHEHISERDWQKAAYFQEFFSKIGQRWLAGGMIRLDDQAEVSIAFSRALGTEPFGETEARFIQKLLPHVERATRVAMKLGRLGASAPVPLTAGLLVANTPSALVGSDGKIAWTNPSGNALIEECPLVTREQDRLKLTRPSEDQLFKRAITKAINKDVLSAGPERLSLYTDSEAYDFEVLPASLPNTGLMGAVSVALVMIRRRGISQATAARLRDLYGFTRAEADLAILVAKGHSIDEAAVARGVKVSTVKAQMRSVFSKADVSRANALAAKVWSAS